MSDVVNTSEEMKPPAPLPVNKDGFVELRFEGDPVVYLLKYDFNTFCDAEELCGVNLLKVSLGVEVTTSKSLRALMFALLKAAHPQVLLHEAGGLMNKDVTLCMRAVVQATGPVRGMAVDGSVEE